MTGYDGMEQALVKTIKGRNATIRLYSLQGAYYLMCFYNLMVQDEKK